LYVNDHPWNPPKVAIVDKCSLFGGHLSNKSSKWDLKIAVIIKQALLLDTSGLSVVLICFIH
jgi:hypothetical protein